MSKSETKNGGPAFPRAGYEVDRHEKSTCDTLPQEGMSLRDNFAARCLPALIAIVNRSPNAHDAPDERCAKVASPAYRIADAMLAARARGHNPEAE